MGQKIYLAICDDETAVLDIVSGAVTSAFRKRGVQAVVETFRQSRELEARMETQAFDLLLLDIDMPGMDGIAFARRLRASGSRVDIIFVSNREDRVFDALRTNPGGFIRKSRFLEDVPAMIDTYMKGRSRRERRPKLTVQNRDGMRAIPLDQIVYVEGGGKVQQLHLAAQAEPLPVRRPMQELETELGPSGFLRIHKGYLANYRFIHCLEEDCALLTNGERIPMSRRRVKEIRERYLELMQD
ncbi:MAG TPA: response regulator transcription factor [Candidatus Onthomonas avicola]|nr:response regulator transcription factor [Candidatus Onthomonas avicola]